MRQKTLESTYYYRHLGYGMFVFNHKTPGNRQTYLVNSRTQTVYDVLDASGCFNLFQPSDLDKDLRSRISDAEVARLLTARYAFNIGAFQEGKARVTWTVDPTVHTMLSGMIDCNGAVVEPFKLVDEGET